MIVVLRSLAAVTVACGIDEYIRQQTGVPAFRADDPIVCTAAGAGRALDDPSLMRRMVVGP
ncbi:MAG: hypothetical protein U0528_20615 [Anaerolineae bacterium]